MEVVVQPIVAPALVTQDRVGAFPVDEQGIGRPAMLVQPQIVEPVDPVAELGAVPPAEPAAAGEVEQVVVAIQPVLGSTLHVDGEARVHLQNVVVEQHVPRVAHQFRRIAARLVDRIVAHDSALPGVTDTDALVHVVIHQVVLDRALEAIGRPPLRGDAAPVRIDVVAASVPGILKIDSPSAAVVDPVLLRAGTVPQVEAGIVLMAGIIDGEDVLTRAPDPVVVDTGLAEAGIPFHPRTPRRVDARKTVGPGRIVEHQRRVAGSCAV